MFNGPYILWNQTRIKAFVDHYGHQFFFKKKVLDLGCGHGDISGVLHRLGAEVTAVDARQEHLKIVAKKYDGVKVVKADLDQPWPFFGKIFDLTLDLALLCHLNSFEAHLKAVCASSNYLILETAVLDSNDPNACIIKPDNKNIYDGSFNGFSCQASAANIERILTQCGMKFQRLDQTKFNSGPYSYDWHSRNDNSFDINKRRIWFCIKNNIQTQVVGNSQPANILPAIHGGTPTPHLTDSKMPLSHQRLVTTTSPAAPTKLSMPPTPVFSTQKQLESILVQNKHHLPSVALLLSGHLRLFSKCAKSLHANLLQNYNVDTYIHTWDQLEVNEPKEKINSSLFSNVNTQDIIDTIQNTYYVKELKIENYTKIKKDISSHCSSAILTIQEKKSFFGGDLVNYASMLYSIQQSFYLLKQSGKHYDMVIRCRPDLVFPDKMNIITHKISNYLFTPNIAVYYNNGTNDQFAFGNQEIMEIYCNMYTDLVSLINSRKFQPIQPEIILRHYLLTKKLNLLTMTYNMKYFIFRTSGTVLYPQGQNMANGDINLIKHLI